VMMANGREREKSEAKRGDKIRKPLYILGAWTAPSVQMSEAGAGAAAGLGTAQNFDVRS
jgi:hypothetical protein